MAISLDHLKNELYTYFDTEISPMIRNEEVNEEMCKHIVIKLNGKFSTKYKFLAKKYGASIRVSANYAPLGIIFFMAETRSGHEKYKFKDPCYWGNGDIKCKQ